MVKKKIISRVKKSVKIQPNQIHNHVININIASELTDCLKNDDLENFKKLYQKDKNILNNFDYHCTGNNTCNNVNIVTCILRYNRGEILKYIIRKNQPKFVDFWYTTVSLMQKVKKEKSIENVVKIFLDMFMYNQLSSNEIGILINKLGEIGRWELVEYLHFMGYMAKDRQKFIIILPFDKLDNYLKYGYKIDEKYFVNLFANTNVPLTIIKTVEEYNWTFSDKNYHKVYKNVFKNRSAEYIKYAVNNGFVVDTSCLEIASNSLNITAILYLYKNGHKITKTYLEKIFLADIPKSNKKKRRARRRYSSPSYVNWRTIRSKATKLLSINNYETDIITILKLAKTNDDKNVIEHTKKILNYCWNHLIFSGFYTLLDYIVNNICDKTGIILSQDNIHNIVLKLIRGDDLDGLKWLYRLDIIEPIDISTYPQLYDEALKNKSIRMLDYFANELSMRCSLNILWMIERRVCKSKSDIIFFIKNIEKVGYPLDEKLMALVCEKGDIDIIKYLHEKGIKPIPKMLEGAIARANYMVANYLISIGCKYSRKNLLDRVLTRIYIRRRCYQKSIDCTVKMIKYICDDLGGTASKRSSNILVSNMKFNLVIHLHKKYGLVPSTKEIVKKLAGNPNWYYYPEMNKQQQISFLKFYKYATDIMKLKIFANLDLSTKDNIIMKMVSSKNPYKELLDKIVKKTNFKFNLSHLYNIINRWYCSVESIKYLESVGLKPTKDMFVETLSKRNDALVLYLHNKYNFVLTLKEFHNIINVNEYMYSLISLKNIIKVLETIPTPYTINLLVDKFINDRYRSAYIIDIINEVKKITPWAQEMIMNSRNLKLKRFINRAKIEIVDYEPTEEEIPDFGNVIDEGDIRDINIGIEDRLDRENNDFVDQVLREEDELEDKIEDELEDKIEDELEDKIEDELEDKIEGDIEGEIEPIIEVE